MTGRPAVSTTRMIGTNNNSVDMKHHILLVHNCLKNTALTTGIGFGGNNRVGIRLEDVLVVGRQCFGNFAKRGSDLGVVVPGFLEQARQTHVHVAGNVGTVALERRLADGFQTRQRRPRWTTNQEVKDNHGKRIDIDGFVVFFVAVDCS